MLTPRLKVCLLFSPTNSGVDLSTSTSGASRSLIVRISTVDLVMGFLNGVGSPLQKLDGFDVPLFILVGHDNTLYGFWRLSSSM